MDTTDITSKLKVGIWEGGTTAVYNLKNGGVGIAPTSAKHVPATILNETEEIRKKIISGEIVVPRTQSEFNYFVRIISRIP